MLNICLRPGESLGYRRSWYRVCQVLTILLGFVPSGVFVAIAVDFYPELGWIGIGMCSLGIFASVMLTLAEARVFQKKINYLDAMVWRMGQRYPWHVGPLFQVEKRRGITL